MLLIPALDLTDGACVRLHQGDFEQQTRYEVDPIAMAGEYQRQGARYLHLVDLDAVRRTRDNRPLIRDLIGSLRIPVQLGGGVRSREDVAALLDAGATRVVIGSICATDPARFLRWLQTFGADRLVAAIDIDLDETGTPWPRIHGWTQRGDTQLWDLLDRLVPAGLKHLLCTDIARDGTLQGGNTELYRDILKRYPDLELQASGGVSSLQDLRDLDAAGLPAAICGKSLLDERFTVREVLDVLA